MNDKKYDTYRKVVRKLNIPSPYKAILLTQYQPYGYIYAQAGSKQYIFGKDGKMQKCVDTDRPIRKTKAKFKNMCIGERGNLHVYD